MSDITDDIRERFKWRKVVAPQTWRPSEVGQELVGYYGGRTLREGSFGQYEVVLVHVPLEGSYMLTGTQLIQLMDASMIVAGHPIRIVWQGLKETSAGHQMKMFDVLVAEGQVIPVEALPTVQ
jgi:hypothetical protein